MELTLQYAGLRRLILSLPFFVGQLQGLILERLPESIFTVTRDQVTQLKADNIESPPQEGRMTIADLISRFPPPNLGSQPFDAARNAEDPKSVLRSVDEILPLYLGNQEQRENGKRKHGRDNLSGSLEEVKRMTERSGIKPR